jgi:hypothetical protein
MALLCCAQAGAVQAHGMTPLPDYGRPPGARNPSVTQENLAATICEPGWARAQRPPAFVTTAIKRRQIAVRHLPGSMADYEEDHLIPLSLGGSAADTRNLWPQPRVAADGNDAARKDRLEAKLHRLVCHGGLTLQAAQSVISSNWMAAASQDQSPATRPNYTSASTAR